MQTTKVTGSAALQSEELKKIAREYGESVVDRSDYDILINPGEAYRQRVAKETKQAESVLEWLSKNYCIVPKDISRADSFAAEAG